MLTLEFVEKSFVREGKKLSVLENINLEIKEGEIVAILGPSGAGKTTLLRIIAGLNQASGGTITFNGQPITGPIDQMTMVFQNFALMPWLTVEDNIALGLKGNQEDKVEEMIDRIGLEGFENAYPREISAGMQGRVAIARALVMEPELLLMDEAFSTLDVLTAENLRNDFLKLWSGGLTRTKSVLMVTHNIEEAALMADRIIIFSNNPGKIKAEIAVNLPRPRLPASIEPLITDVYTVMTTQSAGDMLRAEATGSTPAIGLGYRLPKVEVSELVGLVESLMHTGSALLADLEEEVQLDTDEILLLTEAVTLMRLAKVSAGRVSLTPTGIAFARSDITARKKLFGSILLRSIPLAHHIRHSLDMQQDHELNKSRFLEDLSRYFTEQEAEKVLQVAIDWGRYAELFVFNADTGDLALETVSAQN